MADLIPVSSDDANRQQETARAFYLMGDFFRGADASPRFEAGMVNTSGLLGPQQSSIDVGLGQGGELFIRGRSGQIAATQQAPAPAPRMTIPPLLMWGGLAVLGWMLLRGRKS